MRLIEDSLTPSVVHAGQDFRLPHAQIAIMWDDDDFEPWVMDCHEQGVLFEIIGECTPRGQVIFGALQELGRARLYGEAVKPFGHLRFQLMTGLSLSHFGICEQLADEGVFIRVDGGFVLNVK